MGTACPAHHYRPEIDGLRAVAVVPVVLFHAGFEAFAGGFVGVDVFFVISGYLITSILLADKQAGRFSFAGFYERRARRILPALFIVLATSSAVAWIYLLPSEMKSFGQGVSAAAAFAANVFFFIKGGDYFGLESAANPLLHLWSLGVEEQYYLVFPLLLALALRLGRSGAAAALAVTAFLSLAAAQASSVGHPAAAFYLLPTRGWELIAGCLLALCAPFDGLLRGKAARDGLALLGALLLGCAIAGFDRSLPFPSLYTVIPVTGTALIIAFASPATLVGRLLASPPLVGVGLVSYSAYLWHQPLLAFAHVIADAEPNALARGLLAAASFPLAYVTWRFVETPCRANRRLPGSTVFAMSAAGSLAFFAFGVVGHYNNGYPERSPLYSALASNFGLSSACNGNHAVVKDCTTSTAPRIAVWGDSYAMHLVDGIVATHPAAGLVQLTRDSCPPHGGQPGSACGDFHDRSMQTLLNTPSLNTVVMSSRFESIAEPRNAAALERTIATLKATGRQVVVVGPTPASGANFARCFARQKDVGQLAACNFDRRSILPRHSAVVTALRDIVSRTGAQFVDLTDVICGTTTCRTSADTILIYRDGGHLSRDGSRHVVAILQRDRQIDFGDDKAALTQVRH